MLEWLQYAERKLRMINIDSEPERIKITASDRGPKAKTSVDMDKPGVLLRKMHPMKSS